MEPFDVAVVNGDPTFETKLVIRQLTDSPELSEIMRTIETGEEEAEKMLADDKLAAVILIPEGFSKDVSKGINTPVTVISNEKKPLQAQLVRHVMDSAAKFTSAAQSGINTVSYYMEEGDFPKKERKAQFKQDVTSFTLHILGRGKLFDEQFQDHLFSRNAAGYYIISIFVLLVTIWSFLTLQLMKKRVNPAVYERLASLGYSSLQITMAKGAAVMLFIYALSLFTALPVFYTGGYAESVPVLLFTIFVLASFSVCFFLLIDELIPDAELSFLCASFLIVVGAILGGHLIPEMYFPDWMQRLSDFTVNSWLMTFTFTNIQENTFQWGMGTALCCFALCSLLFVLEVARRVR